MSRKRRRSVVVRKKTDEGTPTGVSAGDASPECFEAPTSRQLTGSVLETNLCFTPGLEMVCQELVKFLVAALGEDVTQRRRAPKSVLVSGPAGCGKSSVVWTALARYRRLQLGVRPVVLYLAGDLFADDDLNAYRSLAAQLHRESARSIEMPLSDSTLMSQLAESGGFKEAEVARNALPYDTASCIEQIVDNLQALLRIACDRATTPIEPAAVAGISGIVLVIDDFDRFARRTQHIRQQLLYSLFNMLVCDDAAPFVIVGITRRFDAVDLLEKRVRSRFSQVVLYAPPPESAKELQTHLIARLDAHQTSSALSRTKNLVPYVDMLQHALSDDAAVARQISELFHHCRMMRPYLCALTHTLAILSREETCDHAKASAVLLGTLPLYVLRRDIRQRLSSLTSTELALLVAHSRVAHRKEQQSASFLEVYDEYSLFVKSSAGIARQSQADSGFLAACRPLTAIDDGSLSARSCTLSTSVALRIFERLMEAELLAVAENPRNVSSMKERIPFVQLFPNDVLREVVLKHPDASTSLQRWCKSWLE
ncbi:hypothetical protein CCYA_CCYA01G0251 [Cyanidiococcus yangmingshanensis]|nr:hypothetical protein CCYA_CCYA01G0251 [Cyanidiococcus yangmingshanensis]